MPPRDLGTWIIRRLKDQGGSQKKLAKALGVHPTFISQIVGGTTAPPLKRDQEWADALGFEGRERDRFLDCYHLAASPLRVQAMVAELMRELDVCREMRKQVLRLSETLGPYKPGDDR